MIFSIWLTAVIIQVVITTLLALQFLKYKKSSGVSSGNLSVVVAAHNELENLKILIPELLNQDHPNFEIVIALDRCTDESANYLRKFDQVRFTEISDLYTNTDPKKNALTQAVEKAKGDWLVFTDADCLPASTSWLSEIASRISGKTQIIIGFSPYRTDQSLLQNFIQFEGFVTAFHYLSMAIIGKPFMAVGRNLAIKKSFFLQQGGYNDFLSITGGDDDLFIQANATSENTNIVLGKKSMIVTSPKRTWKEYWQQKTRHLSVGSRYSTLDQLLHVLFAGTLLCTWVFIPFLGIDFFLPIILFYLLVKGIGYRFAQSKMGDGFNYIWLPLVDLLYAIFLPIVAIRSKLVKDIRWKN